VLDRLGRTSETGDTIAAGDYLFEVTAVDGARISTVRIEEVDEGDEVDGEDEVDGAGDGADDESGGRTAPDAGRLSWPVPREGEPPRTFYRTPRP